MTIHTSDNIFCSNSSPILELTVKFASQICHENINKPLDGAYLADFGIDIKPVLSESYIMYLYKWIQRSINSEKLQKRGTLCEINRFRVQRPQFLKAAGLLEPGGQGGQLPPPHFC